MSVPLIWSTAATENQTADPSINWQEGQPASSLNNSARGVMARLAVARDDATGVLIATLGASNVYSLTTGQNLIDPKSLSSGTPKITKPFRIAFGFDKAPIAPVSANPPKVSIDGSDPFPIGNLLGNPLADTDIVPLRSYEVRGAGMTSAALGTLRILDLLPSDIAAMIPPSKMVGELFDWPSAVTPAGCIEPAGALLSRTDYAALWAFAQSSGMLVSDAQWPNNPGMFSTGDGSTTFRTMDVRGDFIRVLDSGRGVDAGRGLGSFQGDAFRSHTHPLQSGGVVVSGYAGYFPANVASGSYLQIDNIAAVGGPETRPRNTAYRKLLRYK